MFTIVGNNIVGLTSKKESLINLVNTIKPVVGMFQETKLYKKGQFKMENYLLSRTRDNISCGMWDCRFYTRGVIVG